MGHGAQCAGTTAHAERMAAHRGPCGPELLGGLHAHWLIPISKPTQCSSGVRWQTEVRGHTALGAEIHVAYMITSFGLLFFSPMRWFHVLTHSTNRAPPAFFVGTSSVGRFSKDAKAICGTYCPV